MCHGDTLTARAGAGPLKREPPRRSPSKTRVTEEDMALVIFFFFLPFLFERQRKRVFTLSRWDSSFKMEGKKVNYYICIYFLYFCFFRYVLSISILSLLDSSSQTLQRKRELYKNIFFRYFLSLSPSPFLTFSFLLSLSLHLPLYLSL